MFRKFRLQLFIILLFLLNSCSAQAPVATKIATAPVVTEEPTVTQIETQASFTYPINITDDNGRNVIIESEPEKIVSLSPSNTELLFAVGAGSLVIGNTEYCDYPAEAVSITKVGGYAADSISIETIISLKPDLVLADGSSQKTVIEALEKAHIVVIATDSKTFEDVYRNIELVGHVTGNDDVASDLVAEMKARVNSIIQIVDQIPQEERTTVFWEVWDEPLLTAGPNTIIGQIIKLAGGVNIFSDLTEDWPTVSAEVVVQKNPGVIMGPDTHGDKLIAEQLAARSGWNQIDAVKNNRIYLIEGDISSRPGPRVVDALELIAKKLYPDRFR